MPVGVARSAVCCEIRRQLAEQFAINARLYAESVALFTRSAALQSPEQYNLLHKGAEEAQRQAEATGLHLRNTSIRISAACGIHRRSPLFCGLACRTRRASSI
jgi:hypothetical protein